MGHVLTAVAYPDRTEGGEGGLEAVPPVKTQSPGKGSPYSITERVGSRS